MIPAEKAAHVLRDSVTFTVQTSGSQASVLSQNPAISPVGSMTGEAE